MSIKRKVNRIHKNNQSTIDKKYFAEASSLLTKWDVEKPVTTDFYKAFNQNAWIIACHMQGIYQIITQELVDFLEHLIKNQKAIEICCGTGTLGRALKIPLIDRKVHEDRRASAYFTFMEMGSAKCAINYPSDVLEMTANEAFRKYQPDWVIGAWVTQKLQKGKIGMMFGPIEEEFVENANYVHIGTSHLDIHTKKRINKIPHYIIEADWLVTKSSSDKPSQIRIWSKKEIDFDAFPAHLEFDYYLPNK